VGSAPVQEVQLRGSQGLWIENLRLSTYVEPGHQVALQYANLLRRSEGGFEFELSTNPGLPLEAVLQMAKAIQRPYIPQRCDQQKAARFGTGRPLIHRV